MSRYLLILLVCLSSAVSATDRQTKIKALMTAQGTLTTFQQQMDAGKDQSKEHGQTVLNNMLSDFEPSPEYQEKIKQAYNNYIDALSSAWGAEELVAVWSKYYGEHFSEDELDALIKHYSSPLAQKEIVASRDALQNFYAHFAESAVQVQSDTLQVFTDDLKSILEACNCRRKNKETSPDPAPTRSSLEARLDTLLDEARDQRDIGDYATSLESYLKFFEESRDTSFAGVRLSYVPKEMKKMGEDYPPAIEALHKLRDDREKLIFASRISWDVIHEWSSLSEILDGQDYITTVYDQLRFRGNNDPVVLSNIIEQNWEVFIDAGRYSELLSLAFDRYGNLESMVARFEESENADIKKSMGEYVMQEYARVYEVFLATENAEDARLISKKVLSYSKTGATYHALIEAAKSANKDDIANYLLAKAQVELSADEYKIAEHGRPRKKSCSDSDKEVE